MKSFTVVLTEEAWPVGAVGADTDGCPLRLALDVEDVQRDLDRQRPDQSRLTTQRQEHDRAEILSGVFEGRTLGTPIAVFVRNNDAHPGAYEAMKHLYRPSHADFTTEAKYGLRDWRGGGRASARETVGRVAAGAVARILLRSVAGVEVLAWVGQVADIEVEVSPEDVALDAVEATTSAALTRSPQKPWSRASRPPVVTATLWAASSSAWPEACQPASASQSSTSWKRTWPERCCRYPQPKALSSAADSLAPGCLGPPTTTHSSLGRGKSVGSQ